MALRTSLALAAAWALWATTSAYAQNPGVRPPAQPADVYVRIELLRAELNLVRAGIGAPADPRPPIRVAGATPPENYFHALTLYEASGQLRGSESATDASLPTVVKTVDQLRAADVYAVVDAALARVRAAKASLGITATAAAPARDPARTPTDVYRSITQAVRQLRLMLDLQEHAAAIGQPLAAADAIAARLLARFPAAAASQSPATVRGEAPVDVYQQLIASRVQLRALLADAGRSAADVEWSHAESVIDAGDLHDLATVTLTDLQALQATLPGQAPAAADQRATSWAQVQQLSGDLHDKLSRLRQVWPLHTGADGTAN